MDSSQKPQLDIMSLKAILNDPTDHTLEDHNPGHDFEKCGAYKNERIYHWCGRLVNVLPFDDQEQDRQDFLHKVFSVAMRSNDLIHVPHPKNGRFLDLGCGTGIWAIDVAEKLPDALVVGVDIVPMQPINKPHNCQFYSPFDFELPWSLGEGTWDVIHLRMGCGAVVSWRSLYRMVLTHLRHGAWFEQIEIDFEPRYANCNVHFSALHCWYQSIKQATEKAMRPLAHHPRETTSLLRESGFVDVSHHQIMLPLGQWHQNLHERQVGRWYGVGFSESIKPLSVAPFSRILGWEPDRIQRILGDTRLEACSRDIPNFHVLHIYRARRPF
ncbi:class I SAM-dependent methyltransferase [Aspergillus tanneri]|uniref:Velvet complex subunit laeA n=1 Tax=Aspergillus tanneri TaxID=1220188 RepID=A0A5M9M6C2_9EURO|nr:uncharacterized protein ATNIH1004_011530 [Aspergillus tanneri]KAA8642585.1 hypothetical protein ATNIH1004_011530 [Aspergillus tanneri]